ncbi:putative ammonium transporter 1 isoform X2 [Periplaneta americana]|uniref:putative ammonium transporter 1 isoform X2 n=1 Tax=Periplaneta americana TaxID=6978 RepID=UPI0037E8AC25
MASELDEIRNNINDFFLFVNGINLIVMQIGFASLEAGAVRTKNTTNIIMKNLMDVCLSCISYWLVGYALGYGEGNFFLGYTYWASHAVPSSQLSHWFFQFGFAATAATIVSGAVAERCNYIAYIVYTTCISGIIYPIVTHWTWTSEGWLNKLGFVDFSGSGPVYLLGGVCSFIAAILIGPRMGRFGKSDSEKQEIRGHSVPVSVCAGVNKMEFWACFVTGVIAGLTFILLHYFVIFCRVDDPLDAAAIHVGGGFWGLVSAPLFSHGGIVYGATRESALFLAYNLIGALAIIGWGVVTSCIMFGILQLLGILRVTEEEERVGLDISMHNEPGYHPLGWNTFPPVSSSPSPQATPDLQPIRTQHRGRYSKRNKADRLRPAGFMNPVFVDPENDEDLPHSSSRM